MFETSNKLQLSKNVLHKSWEKANFCSNPSSCGRQRRTSASRIRHRRTTHRPWYKSGKFDSDHKSIRTPAYICTRLRSLYTGRTSLQVIFILEKLNTKTKLVQVKHKFINCCKI